jgi:hypothetical protein
MYGMNRMKAVNAQETRTINYYKNIKEKLHKIYAAVWFNIKCRFKQQTPKYVHFKDNRNNTRNTNL